ncbi:MAG: single-strand DNA-binding protein [Nocardioidaceae bacterium]|jgi:single-strand DNA-binding protein|nr:single-strand DNA-binding protein [Nocardioidaceae bacterium]
MTQVATDAARGSVRNEVVLCGRVSIPADERRLPSGDTIMTTRVVIDREQPRRGRSGLSRSKQRVDAIDCVAWTARAQRAIRHWQPGDRVYLEGAIRRRFYRRVDGSPASRVEVEVSRARRLPADS